METEELIVKYINILSEDMRKTMRNYHEKAYCSVLFNLSITQLHYLHAIQTMEGPTFTQLAEKFSVQKSTVTEIIRKLIQKDIVLKKQSEEDLRVFHVYLTKKGSELLAIENMGYLVFAKKMTQCFDEKQKKQFTEFLEIIINNIRK
ncbi:MarR family transcriptional regulator [Megasphaera paucivorans]|uniref:DNA-binding transcriptional regulator, MarR family n=1 Tax=Megasphaera paucivorans TaxID=349095 RepID=A0A1G9XPP6_9FIRM|nr:MarR family transcriptional regulator [Megasphaera paucivorans]SDM98744.1 DNA-binding transcriptional regulator, MarR family [Megasphaera paucivorans]